MFKGDNKILTTLEKDSLPFDTMKKSVGEDAIKGAYSRGYILNRIDKNGIGVLTITGTGLDALKENRKNEKK
jgi:hypothetical protein